MSADERGQNNLPGFENFDNQIGSSKGKNLALISVCVPIPFASGLARSPLADRAKSRSLSEH